MKTFFSSIIQRLLSEFNPSQMGDSLAGIISNLVVGAAVFLAFYLLWKIANSLAKYLLRRSSIDKTTASFITTTLKVVIFIFGAVQALSAVGINMAAMITSLGIAGLTIGFAARDALSNLISGILIFWDRPFIIGDLVEIENYYGKVEKITLRSTRVVTTDGRMLAVPNSTIINSTVISYTNFPHLRLDLSVTISVNEDIDKARNILMEMVKDTSNFMQDPSPRVVVAELNDYNVNLQLQVWIQNERGHIEQRFELREKIFKAFTREGIEMPFETIQLAPFEFSKKAS